MKGQRAFRFHLKYFDNLYSNDEWRSRGFGKTWGWEINNNVTCPTYSLRHYMCLGQVRDCRLEDLLDLALEKDYVRGKVAEYLNKLIEMGVAGFRVDACKHMWPGDLSNVYSRLKTLNTKWFPSGTKPFIYQEVFPSRFNPIIFWAKRLYIHYMVHEALTQHITGYWFRWGAH